jgi:NTP pyrophosphatase (non-canonical NTP hydrolase)
MNFNEYQEQAIKTAIYPRERAVEYPAALLVEEIGELMKCFTKPMRDGGEVNRERAAGELGDCLWALAALAHDWNQALSFTVNVHEFCELANRSFANGDDLEMTAVLLSLEAAELAFHSLYAHERSGSFDFMIQSRFIDTFNQMQLLANALDLSLETIAQRNLDKLADRAARGVIGGEGDTR